MTKNDIQNKKKSSNETIETKSSKERKNSKFGNIIDNLSLQQSINIKDKIKEENLKEQKEDQKSNFEGLTNKSSCEIIFNDDDVFIGLIFIFYYPPIVFDLIVLVII